MTASGSPRLQHLPSFQRFLISQPSIHASLFEDKVFSHDDWRKHRSAAWRHRIEPFVFFRVAIGFFWQLALVVVISVVRDRDQALSSSRLSTPFTMITFALSLLLVFKTNSSYSRWWEGRIIWGQVVNFGRNYARQALMWFPANRPELRAAAIRWAVAAPRVLLAHLREDTDLAAEVDWLLRWSNAPLGAGTALGQLVVAAELSEQLQAEIQKQVGEGGGEGEGEVSEWGALRGVGGGAASSKSARQDDLRESGKLELRHTSRFLMLYVVTSPVLLWPSTGWLTPLVAGVIAFLLLGVENIGVQVEEPFHVLPLYDICRALEANIKELQAAFDGRPGGGPGGDESEQSLQSILAPGRTVAMAQTTESGPYLQCNKPVTPEVVPGVLVTPAEDMEPLTQAASNTTPYHTTPHHTAVEEMVGTLAKL
ncbi:hypothetical protein VOLCADRAFT_97657 [Volvox carteri f. nagariensis]|uniref:Uncharacterized protein n=1 Tax=Volvox carteri f. nagariensis TaxID=3068 RepID=D8UDA6_VOLCA|nr:uncharacterized protein VOLCADRAFT_97657 [Volvox carteri f. nagariensis]EFJ42233.1 hypothetical protein VOLCADRAFT_97657 [Volvox carteri f. nagariensis]|eukprot:XP_002956631.1 hypothetical protein VOLCADRAFT_97657 [Volvox carteri f. nagariensis]